MERIGDNCFSDSGLEEIALPKTLKKMSYIALSGCGDLKKIYVEDGCKIKILNVPDSTAVGSLLGTVAENTRACGLREQSNVVIPEGANRIWSYWFWGVALRM